MAEYKVGDPVGQCASQDCGGDVVYSGSFQATCLKCGQEYQVEFDEQEDEKRPEEAPFESPPPLPTPPPAPPKPKPPAPPKPTPPPPPPSPTQKPIKKLNIDPEQYEELVADPTVIRQMLKIDPKDISGFQQSPKDLNVPDNVVKGSVWKFAQRFGKIGNPYRQNSKSYLIFDIFDEPLTVDQVVKKMIQTGIFFNMGSLVSLYEVLTHCICAGLLLYDEKTRKITQCKTRPMPANLP